MQLNLPLALNRKIPVLNLKDIEFKISSIRLNQDSSMASNINVPITFSDGSSIYIKDDYLLLELIEENVEDQMKNFDIEMFIVQTDSSILSDKTLSKCGKVLGIVCGIICAIIIIILVIILVE